MSWSWKIFSTFGIPVRLHYSMVIIPIIAFSWVPGNDFLSFIIAIALAVLLFSSVLAHELGHSLTARRYGIKTADIVLTPIGGMARMERIPKDPSKEIVISIAGPLVSFAIAGASFMLISMSPMMSLVPQLFLVAAGILYQLNLMLGLFNLVPALPMDGGRVFRGLLSLKYGHLKATKIAAKTGKTLAVIGGLYGIYNRQWSLVFIAFFIYSAANQELRAATMHAYGQQNRNPFDFAKQPPPPGDSYTAPEHNNWTAPPPQDSSLPTIQGGKVEIINRTDPKQK